jgi:hypothetical protein
MLPQKIDYPFAGTIDGDFSNLQSLMLLYNHLAWNARRLHGLMDASGVQLI